jgi:hypothetical protein
MGSMNIESLSKPNSFENLCYLVENSGMNVNVVQSLPFCRQWKVIGHEEIYFIDVTIEEISTKSSKATIFYNEP